MIFIIPDLHLFYTHVYTAHFKVLYVILQPMCIASRYPVWTYMICVVCLSVVNFDGSGDILAETSISTLHLIKASGSGL